MCTTVPLSTQAVDAQDGIARVETIALVAPDKFQRELSRAQLLFDGRRWAQARAGFDPLLRVASGDDKELISLRLGECAYYLDRFSEARKLLQPYIEGSRREAEAGYFYLASVRGSGDSDAYIAFARKFVEDHPDSEWTAETLNNLASSYIVVDRDDDADTVFRELLRRFPRHRYAERAAWKSGWWATGRINTARPPNCSTALRPRSPGRIIDRRGSIGPLAPTIISAMPIPQTPGID